MKVTIKILILVLSIALAIGGIMVYAKTRVEPPTAFQPINQFERDLNQETLNLFVKKILSIYKLSIEFQYLKRKIDLHMQKATNIEINY